MLHNEVLHQSGTFLRPTPIVFFSDTCLVELTNDMIRSIVLSAIIWAAMDSEENKFHN